MRTVAATNPGSAESPNEDFYLVSPDVIVVTDGATVRTDTGCIHGAAWYARTLASEIAVAAEARTGNLVEALAAAIARTSARHSDTCDLNHPGTPSAAVGIVRRTDDQLEYCVLGDVTIAADTDAGLVVISDDRVSNTAVAARAEADRYLIGSEEKAAALLEMKHGELAARNTPDGYWISAADQTAAQHAKHGELDADAVQRLAVTTDGAARIVNLFGAMSWSTALDFLDRSGPSWLLDHVRRLELADPAGKRTARNKASDDATVVFAMINERPGQKPSSPVDRERALSSVRAMLDNPKILGACPMNPQVKDSGVG